MKCKSVFFGPEHQITAQDGGTPFVASICYSFVFLGLSIDIRLSTG